MSLSYLTLEAYPSWTAEGEIETVRRICSNVWFTRIWTVQELLLASSAVFQIGHTECPTAMLYNYLIIAETFAHSESPELQRFQMRNRALETLHPQLSEGKKAFVADIRRRGRSAEADSTELLAMCWQLAGLSDATDSRDKVYGMCGLLQSILPEEATLPEVDYNKPIAQIFEDATRSLIWSTKSLLPLEIIVRPNGELNDLPSWVPDLRDPAAIGTDWQPSVWRHVSNDTKMNIPDYSKLQQKLRERQIAWGSSKPVPNAEMVMPEKQEPGQLPLKAKYLAEVAEVYTRMPVVGRETPDADLLRTACLSEWTAFAFGLEESQPAEQIPPGGYLKALEQLTPALKYMREKHDGLASSSSNSLVKEPRRSQLVDVYDGAVLFRTSCGLLGLCKGHVRLGDRVWQLAADATCSCFIENLCRGSRCGQGGRCGRRTRCTAWSELLMCPDWNRSTDRWFGASIMKNIFMISYLYDILWEQCTSCVRLGTGVMLQICHVPPFDVDKR